ncbi:MAG: 1-phosphofructokinase family hexose kinase [Clostridium sp.]|jgi:1-phosphofructokinase|nr:1-phosphofructokinase family hexose kinase [Clostridium sp.]
MIVTVTANPALDKTAELGRLCPGELNRLRSLVLDAGGKGVNVSKMIAALGGFSLATGFVGGGSGKELIRILAERGISSDFVKVGAVTRTNLKILDCGARLTELNEPGIQVTDTEARLLTRKLAALAKPGAVFVLSGSLCGGVGTDFYARLIHGIHRKGGRAFLDADGEAFRAALAEKPDFIKPNLRELAEYFGIRGELPLDVSRELCRRLAEKGIPKLALSMGRDGALFVSGREAFYAPGLDVEARSPVGAGDCLVGAFAYATDRGEAWEEAAALAMAASAGAVTTVGTKPPSRQLVDQLRGEVKFEALGAGR